MDLLIELAGTQVPVQLRRGGVRRINLRLQPDGTLHLSAPARVSVEELKRFLREHEDWYLRARQKQLQRRCALPAEVRDGAAFWFFGRVCTLRLRQGPHSAELSGDTLILTLPDPAKAQAALEQWYTTQAKKLLPPLMAGLSVLAGVPEPELRFRHMTAAWGNCRRNEPVITLNPRVLCAPPACVKLVVAHELCHLRHPDHSSRFYAALRQVIPEADELQRELAAYSARPIV